MLRHEWLKGTEEFGCEEDDFHDLAAGLSFARGEINSGLTGGIGAGTTDD